MPILDRIFDTSNSTQDVYDEFGKPTVQSAMDGFNGKMKYCILNTIYATIACVIFFQGEAAVTQANATTYCMQ